MAQQPRGLLSFTSTAGLLHHLAEVTTPLDTMLPAIAPLVKNKGRACVSQCMLRSCCKSQALAVFIWQQAINKFQGLLEQQPKDPLEKILAQKPF